MTILKNGKPKNEKPKNSRVIGVHKNSYEFLKKKADAESKRLGAFISLADVVDKLVRSYQTR